MDQLEKLILYGRDHTRKGEIDCQALDSQMAALGTNAGVTAKPNEDAVGVVTLGGEMVLAIADGHWGREASEIAVAKAMELLSPEERPSIESETLARLISLFEQVNSQLYDLAAAAPGASTPETTLIVCQIKRTEPGTHLYWASFGDSFLFLLRDGQLKQLNTLYPRWLGYLSKLSERADSRALPVRFLANEARYVGVAGGLETGLETLQPGDLIFLCTDGLIGSDRQPNPALLYGLGKLLASNLPLVSQIEKAIASALGRGEKDNISCLAARIP